MAPQEEKNITKVKCHQESREGKQKLFSFRWLLRKSKSSRSTKEMSQVEKVSAGIPASKSCDTGLSETVERCPTFLLWKLLSPPGKTLGQNRSTMCSEKMPFRTSFSCSDVYSMVPATNAVCSSGSSEVLNSHLQNTKMCLKYPSHGWYRLHKSIAELDKSSKAPSPFRTEEYLPNCSEQYPCHHVLCKLCLTMVPTSSMYTLHDCNCTFCLTCLQQYLTINIREGNVTITCPDADCNGAGKILVSEIREIAGEDAFYMFERYKLNLDVELDPKRVWCPSVGCETICSFQPNSNPDMGVSVSCITCRTRFCSHCKLSWHGSMTCEDARKDFNDEIELSMSDDENLIKRCPNCRIPIEKDDGCAQMMCYRCKHVFCWHCLASLDDDFLLRHYDKGPCRNKLGHSRASMIWHRTQVVGIFAGFSFLLLMASPFLLLAAPCFFCCRCKNKFFYEEATPL